jgi:hypothetical protein
MATLEPKQDERGRYYRNLGYVNTESRKQPKLFLGRDRVEATARLCRLVQFWEWMKKVGEADGRCVFDTEVPPFANARR